MHAVRLLAAAIAITASPFLSLTLAQDSAGPEGPADGGSAPESPAIPELAQPDEAEAAPVAPRYYVQFEEWFHSEGDEPAYWATLSQSSFSRSATAEGDVDFRFELELIEAVIGSSERARLEIDSGVDVMSILQDPATQRIALGGETTTASFLNDQALDLEPREGTWVQTVTPFDGRVVPGASDVAVELRCSASELRVAGREFVLLTFETLEGQGAKFTLAGAEIDSDLRGAAVLAKDRSLVYQAYFQQSAKVANGDLDSEVTQQSAMTLCDATKRPVLPIDQDTADRIQAFVSNLRVLPAVEDLDPDVLAVEVRPEWSTPLWLCGRIAEASLGLVAEQGTNPLPVTSIGALVLNDQTLRWTGNLLYDRRMIEEGKRPPTQENQNPKDNEYRSPLERAYAMEGAAATRLSERLELFRPEVTGVAQIGDDDAFVIGTVTALLLASAETAGVPSQLKIPSSSASTSMAHFAAGPGVAFAAPAAAAGVLGPILAAGGGALTVGAGIVVAGAELSDELDDDDDDIFVDPNAPVAVVTAGEVIDTGPGACNELQVTLDVSNIPTSAPETWQLELVGPQYTDCANVAQAPGNVVQSASSGGGATVSIQVQLTDVNSCVDVTVRVLRNGVPTRFSVAGLVPVDGEIQISCM